MCGLIAAFNTKKEKVNDFIINQYEEQHSRGQKGFGIIRINEKNKIEIDRACEPTKFLIDLYLKQSNMIIAHHRQPTSTDNTLDQTHPILVSNKQLKYDYYIIHNGMVSNDDELRKIHIDNKFSYTTEYTEYSYSNTLRIKWNDSETLAIELALFIENKINEIRTESSAAFIALQINKKTNTAKTIFFGKNGTTPLKINRIKNEIQLSSEGNGEMIESNQLYSFNLKNKKPIITFQPLPFKKEKEPERESDKNYRHITHYPINTLPFSLQSPKTTEKTETQKSEELDKELKKLEQNPLRNWINNTIEEDEETTRIDPIEYAGKEYIGYSCKRFKDQLENTNSTEITHIIDDTLDEEITLITTILTEYKDTLLNESLTTKQINFYLDQINRILLTMRALTNIADREYNTKGIQEEMEEYSKDFSDTPPQTWNWDKEKKEYVLNKQEKTKPILGF